MGKKIVLVLLLVVVLIGVVLVRKSWLSRVGEYPSLFPVAEYKLAENWYLGRFQPVYLWQYDQEGATYFRVLYKGAGGSWKTGDVLVGGRYADVDILWVPYNSKDQKDGGVTSSPEEQQLCEGGGNICQLASYVGALDDAW